MSVPEQKTFSRIPEASPSGGWRCSDEEALALQNGVVWDLIKQLGQNITQGHSLINITLPVRIFEPRSYLQRIVDSWCYAAYLTKAAKESDPVERMKNVVTFAIAGFSNTCLLQKPFNPILGETFQAVFPDGAQIFCEQSSHHPPISNWQLFGPNDLYHFYGYGEWTASFRGNFVRASQKGPHLVEFHDGGSITYDLPEILVRGVMVGERILDYEGLMKFRDKKNKLGCDIRINPDANNWFFAKNNLTDYLEGTIFQIKGTDFEDVLSREVLSTAEGTWLGCIQFDGITYWDWQEGGEKFVANPIPDPLPSDSRFREDLVALAGGDLVAAADWKARLENKQRREAKLRKDGIEKRKRITQNLNSNPTKSTGWFY